MYPSTTKSTIGAIILFIMSISLFIGMIVFLIQDGKSGEIEYTQYDNVNIAQKENKKENIEENISLIAKDYVPSYHVGREEENIFSQQTDEGFDIPKNAIVSTEPKEVYEKRYYVLYPDTNQHVDNENKIVRNHTNFSYLAESFDAEMKYDIERKPFFVIETDKNVLIVTETISDRSVKMKNGRKEAYVSLMIEKYNKKEYTESGGIEEYTEDGKKKNEMIDKDSE